MNNSIQYLVKKGDTLQSIASELGINNPLDLRHYHNMNAGIKDGIGPEPPVGKMLLTPPQNEIETINKKNEEWQKVVNASKEKQEQEKQLVEEKEQQKQEQHQEQQKEAEKNAHDNKYFVVHGALCCCDKAENPKQTAKLLVTSQNKVIYNAESGKYSATDADKTFDPAAATFGKCTLKPSSGGNQPCALTPAPKWEKVYEKTSIKGSKLLTEISTLQCTVGGKIEVIKSGQKDTIMKEHAENTNSAALALINPAIKMPLLETAYPSVSNITLKSLKNKPDFKPVSSADTTSVEKIILRLNDECNFLATIKKGNVNLTSWVIYDGFTGDKDKRLLIEEQLGASFKYTFSVLGKYRIEGYGKPKKEDFEGGKYNKNYPDCSIDVEVVVNKLDGTELVPIDGENFARIIGGKMRLRQNFPANFKAKFLMTPTSEELANLKMYVTDASGNVLKSTRIENTVSFTPVNTKAKYTINAIYKFSSEQEQEQKQSFSAETISNSVSQITHNAEVIRPGTPMTFGVKESRFSLYIPDEQDAISREVRDIKWNLNGRLMGNGKSITIPGNEFMNLKEYVVEAYVTLANAYGQNAKHEEDDWHFEVKENDVIAFSYNGVPKVGKTTQLVADQLIFPDLPANEMVVWDTTIPHTVIDEKIISITPLKAGKEIVKCRINRQKGKALSIDVKQAKVLGMLFTDSNGIEIEKSSWHQTVNIWVKQEHLIGEEIAIEIWDNVKGYCKVINVPKYDGNLVPLTLDSYIKGKAGGWAKLYVKIGAPKLELANPNYIFEAKNILDVEDKREIYSAQIGSQDAKQRHYHVDYNQVSYFYGKSRGIKAGEKLKITIYEKGKMLFEVLPPDVKVDTSGAIQATLKWDRISEKLPSRTVYAVVQDGEGVILHNGAKTANGGVAITKKSALLGLAEYKSAVLVGKADDQDKKNEKSKLIIFPLLVKPENDENKKWGKTRNWAAIQRANMTTFNSNRSAGRRHAGRDLYTKPLETVVAIADGVVLDVRLFYCETHQVTIRHTLKDGRDFIIRYGELDSDSITVKVGDKVKQKKPLGKTGKLLKFIPRHNQYEPLMTIDDTIVFMLHFEHYSGTLGFDLVNKSLTTNSGSFLRRADLVDSLAILQEGYENSFGIKSEANHTKENGFNEQDAREALMHIYNDYGREIAVIVEKMCRAETAHFTSEQYKICGTGGMEASKNIHPYYGWDSTTYKNHPEYTPIGTWLSKENKGLSDVGGNKQVTDQQKVFIKLPSVLAGMVYKADYIKRYDGNYARWQSATNPVAQEAYRNALKGVIARIVNSFK